MQWDLWLAFVGASIAISVPRSCPSIRWPPGSALRRGVLERRRPVIGLMTQLAVVAIGLGAAVAKSVVAFTVIKWVGVLYLIYLAVRQWRTIGEDLSAQVTQDVDARAAGWRCCCAARW